MSEQWAMLVFLDENKLNTTIGVLEFGGEPVSNPDKHHPIRNGVGVHR